MEKYLLIDGNSVLFRGYYATFKANLKTSTGIPTGAVKAFINMVRKSVQTYKPTHILVAFDKGKNTFRHKEFEDYKAGRRQTPNDLITQLPIAREFLNAVNIKWYENDELEADDIVGCMKTVIEKNNIEDYQIDILTSDRDLLQLIDNKTVVHLMKSGITDTKEMTHQSFVEEWGFAPKEIIDYKALVGDKSDNIPGVKKIGEKTGQSLVIQFGTIENIYENLNEIPERTKLLLEADKDNAFKCKRLATILTDYDMKISIEDIRRKDRACPEFYQKYEMKF